MIKVIDRVPIFDRGYVELWDFSEANTNSHNRINAVTEVAKVCRNIEVINNPIVLYHKLLHEHAGRPSEIFQFIPIFDSISRSEFDNDIIDYRFGEIGVKAEFYSNLRNYVNPLKVPYSKAVRGFCVCKVKIPLMIAAQIRTHGQLSINQMSERHVKIREYYMPRELTEKIGKEDWDNKINKMSQNDFDLLQKQYKIRQELTNKGSHGLAYTTMWIAGWLQDKTAWSNYFDVRLVNPTQFEHKAIARAMYDMIRTHDHYMAYKYLGARHV